MTITDAPAAVSEVISTINRELRAAGGDYAGYACKTVSWDDVQRGTVGGSLSCWGGNITDTRLYAKSGQQLYTVRSDNFNEKLGAVSASELALITGNQTPGGGALTPITLKDVLKNFSTHAKYAGVDAGLDLFDAKADEQVSIRFMTTFLPVADEELSTLEFAPEVYQYQTRTAKDPANLLLLATTQGMAVQANGSGATKLFHHAVEPSGGQIARYWFEAERSKKKVGGAQVETKEEALEAASRGKATASVIGTRSMGTRFNILMTIQVPLQQQPPARRAGKAVLKSSKKKSTFVDDCFVLDGCESDDYEEEGGKGKKSAVYSASDDEYSDDCMEGAEEDWEEEAFTFGAPSDDDWCMAGAAPPVPMACALAAAPMMRGRSRGGAPRPPKVGKANAARVSRGSMVDKLDKTVEVKAPKRDPSQHVTVTVVIYNTVAGGVPSAEDVRAAVDDMEQLYASCGWKGRLADEGASFMKAELTVKNMGDIAGKLAEQPYVPPTGAIGLVQGGDVFPTSAA